MLLLISLIANAVLLVLLLGSKKKDMVSVYPAEEGKVVKKTFKWELDSAKRTKLKGNLTLEMDVERLAEQRRNNPYASPTTSFENHDRLREMYYYMLANPETLACSARIVQYINRLCSQRNIGELDKLQFVLDFVQEPNIRYRLDGESEELLGAVQYIRYPDETLFDGHGDCDCKSFLAATLYHLMGYNVLYLLSRTLQHAAICVEYDKRWGNNLNQQSNIKDVTVEIDGRWYIFCETTSDGFRIGGIGESKTIKNFETMLELRA